MNEAARDHKRAASPLHSTLSMYCYSALRSASISTAMADKLSYAKQAALNKLKEKCISTGANACVGVDFDIMTLGSNMLVASASGTAVILDDEEKED